MFSLYILIDFFFYCLLVSCPSTVTLNSGQICIDFPRLHCWEEDRSEGQNGNWEKNGNRTCYGTVDINKTDRIYIIPDRA